MVNELYHHGIKGQRWGVRRYQNKDGTLTKAGKRKVQVLQRSAHADVEYANDPDYNKATKKLFKASKISGRNVADAINDEELTAISIKREAANWIRQHSTVENASDRQTLGEFIDMELYFANRHEQLAKVMRSKVKDLPAPTDTKKYDGLSVEDWIERETKFAERYIQPYLKQKTQDIE